jgi:cytochrome c553
MKLYHSRYILPALAGFLVMATLPVWRGAAARGSGFQSPPNPQGQRCLEPKAVMRAGHMRLLLRWRDEVVREDRRLYIASDGRPWEKSLVKTCLACHGPADARGKSTTAATACNECHSYVNVKLDCWNCHLDAAIAGVKTVDGNAMAHPGASREEP